MSKNEKEIKCIVSSEDKRIKICRINGAPEWFICFYKQFLKFTDQIASSYKNNNNNLETLLSTSEILLDAYYNVLSFLRKLKLIKENDNITPEIINADQLESIKKVLKDKVCDFTDEEDLKA